MFNFAQFVGPVDQYSAAVLVVFAAGLTIMVSIALSKRRSRRALDQDFALAQIKEKNSQELGLRNLENRQAMAEKELASKHQLESERISQGLMLSHTKDVSPQA